MFYNVNGFSTIVPIWNTIGPRYKYDMEVEGEFVRSEGMIPFDRILDIQHRKEDSDFDHIQSSVDDQNLCNKDQFPFHERMEDKMWQDSHIDNLS